MDSSANRADSSPKAEDPPPPPAKNITIADGNVDEGECKQDDGTQDQQELPIEYQLHEVDLNNPNIDPLEYTFRRFVPIPKVYFWETADESNDFHQNLPIRVKLWHNTIYYLGVCLKKAESAGEIVANILGLNGGEFDYVTNTMTEEQWSQSRRNVEIRREESRRRQEEREMRENNERGEDEVVSDVGLSSRNVL
ncbi:hypothetical protein HJC23_003125 [Cyclotella cryptica]|uniref:Uncharacterized protein n=1 Tax=Cyclotella cryptica TaxID=29204 RepID=A0ABD3P5Y1_9STRA|eukprot:CCRYP_017534-RA/>CCRYP_017534-RA protein AED:0.32 eAED:0.32 QI:0/-1/0/1/-1/1/1/0/194